MPLLLALLIGGGLAFLVVRRELRERGGPPGSPGGGGPLQLPSPFPFPQGTTAPNITRAEVDQLVTAANSSNDPRQVLVWSDLARVAGYPAQSRTLEARALEIVGVSNPPATLTDGLAAVPLEQGLFMLVALADRSPANLNRAAAIARVNNRASLASYFNALNPAQGSPSAPPFTPADLTALAQSASASADYINQLVVAQLLAGVPAFSAAPPALRRAALAGNTNTQFQAGDPAWIAMLGNLPLSVQIAVVTAAQSGQAQLINRAADIASYYGASYGPLIRNLVPSF